MNPKAEQLELNRRKKLEEDTYKVRRKEGRPKHGMTSMSAMCLSMGALVLQCFALMMPHWRSSHVGVLGYPHPRHWGLFTVSGKDLTSHYEMSTKTCHYYAQLNVGGICASPICMWYRVKCEVYIDFMMYSYGCAAAFTLEFFVQICCIVWTCRFTPRHLRWARAFYFVIVCLHIPAIVLWATMTEELFGTLGGKSFYPLPELSYSFFISCLAGTLLCINCILGVILCQWWPEVTLEDLEDDSDEDTDEGDNKFLQPAAPAVAQVPMQVQAQGYAAPQAYDPASFQQGYGAPMPPPYGAPSAGDFGVGAPPGGEFGYNVSVTPASDFGYGAPVVSSGPAVGLVPQGPSGLQPPLQRNASLISTTMPTLQPTD